MSRRQSKKSLKRVCGDLQLASIKIDLERPPTAGAVLRRCWNNTSLDNCRSDNHQDESLPSFIISEREITAQAQDSHDTIGNQLKVPNNTACTRTAMTAASSALTEVASVEVGRNRTDIQTPHTLDNNKNFVHFADEKEKWIAKNRQSFHQASESGNSEFEALNHQPNRERESPNQTFFTAAAAYATKAKLTSGFTITEKGISNKFEKVELSAAVITTTAVPLGLPASVQETFPSQTPSPIWSLQNNVGSEATVVEEINFNQLTRISQPPPQSSNSTPMPPSSTSVTERGGTLSDEKFSKGTSSSSRSKLGDGDTMTATPTTTSSSENRTSLTPTQPRRSLIAPPPSVVNSGSDRPPFMLTFRRPKLLPRSRITNSAGSTRYSLPMTASSPDSFTQQDTDLNNNILTPTTPVTDQNNNEIEVEEDINNNVELVKRQPSKTNDRSLLSLLMDPITRPPTGFSDVVANPVEQAGTNPPSAANAENPVKPKIVTINTNDETAADTAFAEVKNPHEHGSWRSTDSSELTETSTESSSSKSKSTESKKPKAKKSESLILEKPKCPNPMLLKAEKGQIRFFLPGRIQHKTTIKVAHFPTDDNKKIILDMKPEDEDQPELINLPSKGIAFDPDGCNRNIYLPPSNQPPYYDPCGAYGYPPYPYPYGYPPYGYYDYGYPPYY